MSEVAEFEFVSGDSENSRNSIPLRAKFVAVSLTQAEGDEKKTAKEALAAIAEEFDLDAGKSSWTKYAGSTITRFRDDIKKKLAADNEEALELQDEFQVNLEAARSEQSST